MTYGQLKLRLTQAFPGISLDLIEGWINDRYQEILAELPWTRLTVMSVLQTTAPYTQGTVTVTQGSNTVGLLGGAWNQNMDVHCFRVSGDPDFYEFHYINATTAALDRAYDGTTKAGAAYSLSQSVYVMPTDCRFLQDDAFNSPLGPLTRFTHQQIDAFDPQRMQTGTPRAWCSYMDSDNVPPQFQVELWPQPDKVMSLPFTYQSTGGDLTSEDQILQVWMQPAALVEGVTSKIKAHMKDYTGAQFHAAAATAALKTMRGDEAQKLAPAEIRLTDYYVAYRRRRWNR